MTNPLPNLPDLSDLLLDLTDDLSDLLPDLTDLSRAPGAWLATLGVGLAVGLPMSGAADPLPRPLPTSFRWLSPNADRPPAWMGENVHYKKGVGLEYRHEMKLGDSPIELGFQGPIVRKKKSVGLTVEVRF